AETGAYLPPSESGLNVVAILSKAAAVCGSGDADVGGAAGRAALAVQAAASKVTAAAAIAIGRRIAIFSRLARAAPGWRVNVPCGGDRATTAGGRAGRLFVLAGSSAACAGAGGGAWGRGLGGGRPSRRRGALGGGCGGLLA